MQCLVLVVRTYWTISWAVSAWSSTCLALLLVTRHRLSLLTASNRSPARRTSHLTTPTSGLYTHLALSSRPLLWLPRAPSLAPDSRSVSKPTPQHPVLRVKTVFETHQTSHNILESFAFYMHRKEDYFENKIFKKMLILYISQQTQPILKLLTQLNFFTIQIKFPWINSLFSLT